ncbi:transposase [Terrabacter sp. NPDC000476]|uniref:transposase n=1 Tax=Terrabacter sp. NPDC000476 TaxID=3154258 RepID=UPI003329F6D9
MPRPHPPEFRQRAVELAQLREQPIGKIAADLGISESCLRRWVRLAEGSSGRTSGRAGQDTTAVLDAGERAELIELRRKTRVQAMEIDILKRASAYFARDVLPDPK